MIKGTRITRNNRTYAIGTTPLAYNMLTIPTGKTFVMTDLVIVGTAYTQTIVATAGSCMQLILYDEAAAGASGTTAGLIVHLDTVGSTSNWCSAGKVMHWTNGPEFTVGVSPMLLGTNGVDICTFGLFVGGVLK